MLLGLGAPKGGHAELDIENAFGELSLVNASSSTFAVRLPNGPPTERFSGELAPITPSSFDIHALISLRPGLANSVAHLLSDEGFAATMREQPRAYQDRCPRSRLPKKSVDMLCAAGVWEEISPEEAAFTSPVFSVLKKAGLGRLIFDGSLVNARFRDPPAMGLPCLRALLSEIAGFQNHTSYDAKAFFYQIKLLSPLSRRFFATKVSRARGRPAIFSFLALPMGWSWAPFSAQKIAQTIVDEVLARARRECSERLSARVWVDNFVLMASSPSGLAVLERCFRDVCAETRLEIHPPQSGEYLGFAFPQPGSGRLRFGEGFAKKCAASLGELAARAPTLRQVARGVGLVVWWAWVRGIPFSRVSAAIRAAKAAQVAVQNGGWDSACPFSAGPLREQLSSISEIAGGDFEISFPRPSPGAAVIFSDAAVEAGFAAQAFVSGGLARSWPTGPGHIFLQELSAATAALTTAAAQGYDEAVLFTDNSAALFALRKGNSSNAVASAALSRFFGALPPKFRFWVGHVSSAANPADVWTRRLAGLGAEGPIWVV
jgi:hypothetical protein